MTARVLVVGAILLDVTAVAQSDQSDKKDRIGDAKINIGGSAFNIAMNLKRLGHNISLFTCLKKESAISEIIKNSLIQKQIDTSHIFEREDLPEPIFIAISQEDSDGCVNEIGRITSSPIQEVQLLSIDHINSAIKTCSTVIADTNLNADQLKSLNHLCKSYQKKLFIACSSDSKSSRISEANEQNCAFDLVSMNEKEAQSIGLLKYRETIMSIDSKILNSDVTVIISNSYGASIYLKDGSKFIVNAPKISGKRFPSGIEDAVFSGVCHTLISGNLIADETELSKVTDIASTVLRTPYPNLDGSHPALGKSKSFSSAIGFICGIGALASFLFGAGAFGTPSLTLHLALSLVAAGLAGGFAAWIQPLLQRTRGDFYDYSLTATNSIVAGIVVGSIAALVGALPHVSALMEHEIPSKSSLIWHIFLTMIVGAVAGLTLHETGREFAKKFGLE